eukprot:gene8043-10898_t
MSAIVGIVPTLTKLCQNRIMGILEKNHLNGRLINDLCKAIPDELLEPIFEMIFEKGMVTETALISFLVPNRLKLKINQAITIRKSIFKQIGLNCPNLTNLDLSDCSQVNNSVVRSILQGCPVLQDIQLNRCVRVTDAAFDANQSPFASLVGCFSLEAISLQGCPQITGEVISTLNKSCRKLKYLNLSQCKHVKSPTIQQIFEHRQLLSVNLGFIDDISDEAFHCFTIPSLQNYRISPQIQRLNIGKSRVTDITLSNMSSCLLSLVEIVLQWCSNVTDAGIIALAMNCPKLRIVDLKSCGITDETIISLASMSCELRSLDLSWCHGFTSDGIRRLVPQNGEIRCLEQLKLVWCPQITDETLHSIGNITTLEVLDVSGCGGVTVKGIEALKSKGIDVSV